MAFFNAVVAAASVATLQAEANHRSGSSSPAPQPPQPQQSQSFCGGKFQQWLANNQRDYATERSSQEFQKRERIFCENLDKVEAFNLSRDNSSSIGLNKFADKNIEELRTHKFGLLAAPEDLSAGKGTYRGEFEGNPKADLPESVDWREKGAVTEVKNQEACGSCWSFSTTGSIEGRMAINRPDWKLTPISEQQFVDCDDSADTNTDNNGCLGGLMTEAFQWAEKNDLVSEECYPYHEPATPPPNNDYKKFECKTSKCPAVVPKGAISGFKSVAESEEALMAAVAEGPVSVAIAAGADGFMRYTGGVLTSGCGEQLDHGVLVVGYGTEKKPGQKGQDYWIVKNSWGEDWGENGYVRIARGKHSIFKRGGMCGILESASFPTIEKQSDEELMGHFDSWLSENPRSYTKDTVEYRQRLQHFRSMAKWVAEHNANPNKKYKVALNKFADEYPAERKQRLGVKRTYTTLDKKLVSDNSSPPEFPMSTGFGLPNVQAPSSIDWAAKGAVTDIKNQGRCGSCWSFSTTGGIEGAWQIATGKLLSISEQQFVDCDTVNDHGCMGGLMTNALTFAHEHALCSEKEYPYIDTMGPQPEQCGIDTCEGNGKPVIPKGAIASYQNVPQNDSDAMMRYVLNGPVSIAIQADQQSFQMYDSGIFSDSSCCYDERGNGTPCSLDHGVLLVGFGSNDDGDFWKVKNSWGPEWGMNGYILMGRGKDGSDNQGMGECGLLAMGTVPQLDKKVTDEARFDNWLMDFPQNYSKGSSEYNRRKAIFLQNFAEIVKLNNDATLIWSAGLNKYSDMSNTEAQAALAAEGATGDMHRRRMEAQAVEVEHVM